MRRIMTEAEAVELIAIYTANGIDSITLYISFTSAYLATAYFAGQNLTRFQVLSASGLFCLGAIAAALTCVASVQAWDEIMRDNRTVIDSVPIYASNLWLVMMPALFSAGILVSIYFMWNVRHPRKQ
jgi:hypothetical protein